MPPDPDRLADTRAWFVKATSDLRMAKLAAEATPPLCDQIVYHAQQVAEKAMKGLLTYHDQPFRKTHNLVEIGEACRAIDAALEPMLARAARLTEYAWLFRYPGGAEEPTMDEALEAIAAAEGLLRAILSQLPAETHP